MLLELLYNSFCHVHRVEKRLAELKSEFNSRYGCPMNNFVIVQYVCVIVRLRETEQMNLGRALKELQEQRSKYA